MAMMDFVVRESRAIVDGPMIIIRYCIEMIWTEVNISIQIIAFLYCCFFTIHNLFNLRFGTCGSINPNFPIGSIAVCTESIAVLRNYDAFHSPSQLPLNSNSSLGRYYNITQPIQPDPQLHEWLKKTLESNVKEFPVVNAMNATCDSFYSSQGLTLF
jgi:uridine phosphorylase